MKKLTRSYSEIPCWI